MIEVQFHYIPKTIGELNDHLGMMMLYSPRFVDTSGYLPGRSVATVFHELNEGLALVRNKVGEDNYARLIELSTRMRAHFEADPEDNTDEATKGRECIVEMEDILSASNRRKR